MMIVTGYLISIISQIPPREKRKFDIFVKIFLFSFLPRDFFRHFSQQRASISECRLIPKLKVEIKLIAEQFAHAVHHRVFMLVERVRIM